MASGLRGHIARAIVGEAAQTGVDRAARGFTANELSDLLLDGLEGMKARLSQPEEQRTTARGLVRVIELAIRP